MPKLLQLTAIHPAAQARLEAGYDLIHANLADIDPAWLTTYAGAIDGVVTGGHLGVPSTLPNLKVIGINGVGFDKIDLDLARRSGVRVANTPDVLPSWPTWPWA